ncbi:DUF3726 domain-containing protein [Primorskyibacter sp. S187A]|uniref:DUF3726 domain-containing protein n=1 Tax=Primorskyibacter sp. S187A TaxID=3415130 RepID=UPI003C7EB115
MSAIPHDQTRGETTPYFSELQSAPLSCNEAASLCMKAARGAGMTWGLAEEAGFAAAWLVAHGLDGPSYLRAHLERADGKDWQDLCPTVVPGSWQNAKGYTACPIILGATMCDYAGLPEGPVAGARIALGPVSAPILLLPFLADLGRRHGLSFTLSAAQGAVDADGDEASLQRAATLLDAAQLELTLSVEAAHLQATRQDTAASQKGENHLRDDRSAQHICHAHDRSGDGSIARWCRINPQ